jgi:hypothetical protein
LSELQSYMRILRTRVPFFELFSGKTHRRRAAARPSESIVTKLSEEQLRIVERNASVERKRRVVAIS